MCRIAGILNDTIPIATLENTVEQMCMLLKHGGPDDGGIFAVEAAHLVLGNRRLSLLDLSAAGHQPMHYNNRFTITYNGELYNYSTLKSQLMSAGLRFTTGTDTEVILAAFATWNTQSFAKLNGMFAFALWDNKEHKLYLVRDAAGIKPLYYSTTSGVAFASEIRAFAPIHYLQNKNETAKVYQLAYGYIPEPVTILAGVKPLPKGCFFVYDTKTKLGSVQTFSFFSFSDTIKDETVVKKIIYDSLEAAVQRQMVADAAVGVFLSGGIDSAIIAQLANATKSRNKLHTLSIYFEEEKYSEKKYQDIVAQSLSSTHHSILLKESHFHTYFPQILDAMDMPTCDGINTWFISKFAADEGLKAVLSGVGADELFGGYPSFARIHKAILLQKLPNISLGIGRIINARKYGRVSYLQITGIRGLYLFLRGHFTPIQIAKQLGGYEKEIWNKLNECPTSPVLSLNGEKNVASWMEFNMYMQDQLLRDADVMSMARGLEIRVPFLDNDVVKPVFSMSSQIKFAGKVSKQLLIDSFDKILPTDIWNRPKMGFSFPFAEWLANSEYVRVLEQSKNVHTQKACKDFLQGKLHWSRIMSLIVLKHKKHLV